MSDDLAELKKHAQSGLAAMIGEDFGQAEVDAYRDALDGFERHLFALPVDPTIISFLEVVIDFERQGVDHIIFDSGEVNQ